MKIRCISNAALWMHIRTNSKHSYYFLIINKCLFSLATSGLKTSLNLYQVTYIIFIIENKLFHSTAHFRDIPFVMTAVSVIGRIC